jgi:hypothetical protein
MAYYLLNQHPLPEGTNVNVIPPTTVNEITTRTLEDGHTMRGSFQRWEEAVKPPKFQILSTPDLSGPRKRIRDPPPIPSSVTAVAYNRNTKEFVPVTKRSYTTEELQQVFGYLDVNGLMAGVYEATAVLHDPLHKPVSFIQRSDLMWTPVIGEELLFPYLDYRGNNIWQALINA